MAVTPGESEPPATYAPLRGNTAFIGPVSKAYLGDDHLLVTTQGMLRENLHRYYFRDIEAISCTRTRVGGWVSLVLGLNTVLMLVAGLLALAAGLPGAGAGIFIVLGGFLAAVTAVNVVRGPTCVTLVHTRVHSAPLRCFSRWRRAQAAIQVIRSHVGAAQGLLTQEELTARLTQVNGPQAPARVVVSKAEAVLRFGAPPQQPFRASSQTAVAMLLMLLYSVACGLNVLGYSLANLLLAQFLLAFTVLAIVAALVRQYNTTVPQPVSTVTWVAFIVLLIPHGSNASAIQMQAQLGAEFAENNVVATIFQSFHGFIALLALVTGLLGLIVVLSNRERPAVVEESPSEE